MDVSTWRCAEGLEMTNNFETLRPIEGDVLQQEKLPSSHSYVTWPCAPPNTFQVPTKRSKRCRSGWGIDGCAWAFVVVSLIGLLLFTPVRLQRDDQNG
jgi:hypothetical protein